MKELESLEKAENIAIFTHYGVLHTILYNVLGGKAQWFKFSGSNCGISIIEWNGAKWSLKAFNR